MPVDPSQFFGPTLYPGAGWLRTGQINGVPTILDSWDIQVTNEFTTRRWAIPVPQGVKQKTLSARGTTEVSFDLRGDLTIEGAALVGFLSPALRGVPFPITVQQFGVVDLLVNCYLENFSLTGAAGAPVKFQMRGKSLSFPISGTPFSFTSYQHLVPSWATGASLVDTWQMAHSVGLMPVWWNNQNPLPAYYRFGDSEYDGNITTVYQEIDQSIINLGVGGVEIIGVVRSRGIQSSGREVRVYPIQITNVNLNADTLTPGANVIQSTPSFQGAPDGI